MKRRERDLVCLFNALWYRSFPVELGHTDIGRRAVWTTHISHIVKQIADFKGYFTRLEYGGRTDAVIQTADRENWARIEWEWSQPRFTERVNEIAKLSDAMVDAKKTNPKSEEVAVFIGYSDKRFHRDNMDAIASQWKAKGDLIAFVVQFEIKNGSRHFLEVRTYTVRDGECTLRRTQPALPWDVKGSRWKLVADASQLPADAAAELATEER